MAPPQDTDAYLANQITDLLTVVEAEFVAAGRTVDRVVQFPGMPTWDCEMLTGYLTKIAIKDGRSQVKNSGAVTVLGVGVTILRCVTAIEGEGDPLPSAATVNADGVAFTTDAWILHRSIVRELYDGTVFDRCSERRVLGTQSFTPQGGLAAATTTIEVTA